MFLSLTTKRNSSQIDITLYEKPFFNLVTNMVLTYVSKYEPVYNTCDYYNMEDLNKNYLRISRDDTLANFKTVRYIVENSITNLIIAYHFDYEYQFLV